MVDDTKETNVLSKLFQRTSNQTCRKKTFGGKEMTKRIRNPKNSCGILKI
jgi:hypothetical protein